MITVCPFCNRGNLQRHCPTSPTCTWIKCIHPDCDSYGTPDGKRWARRPKAGA